MVSRLLQECLSFEDRRTSDNNAEKNRGDGDTNITKGGGGDALQMWHATKLLSD